VFGSVDTAGPSRLRFIRFGIFEVDLRAGELRKHGVKVKVQEQPFRFLQMLVEHSGEIVTREQLQKQIWPADTFVDFDQGLNNTIKRLRESLNDSAESPHFIETIPRRGYRFIGKITEKAPERVRSLAVLPLENLSRDPEQEYFAEGRCGSLLHIRMTLSFTTPRRS
jgi:DNA-binding winged helix-turn-helix (wHTH) protein